MNTKKIFSLLCLALCLLLLLCACGDRGTTVTDDETSSEQSGNNAASDAEVGTEGLAYEMIDAEQCRVCGIGTAQVTAVKVPARHEGRAVTEVGENAFAETNITSVELPASVNTLGAGAFDGCANLTSLTLDGAPLFAINGTVATDKLTAGKNALRGTLLMNITLEDSHDGDTAVALTVERPDANVAAVEITAALNTVTDMTTTVSFAPTAAPATVDFGTYGIFRNVRVTAKDAAGKTMLAATAGEVAVTAPSYNIAYLNATYPVLVYSLSLKEITENGTIPTFTFLERSTQYDWDHLTYGMRPLPYLTRAAATTDSSFHRARAGCAAWIADLYAADPTSHFNLYIVDNYEELLLEFLIGNGIPETNWNAVLLSDGTGTAGYLVETFAVNSPADKAAMMANDWLFVKYDAMLNGYDPARIHALCSVEADGDYSILAPYTYPIVKTQSNVAWWVNRLRTGENLAAITAEDAEFAAKICEAPRSLYTNGLLAALSEEEQLAFKSMYHFSDTMFTAARDADKKIMVVLGTANAVEGDDFYGFMKLTMTFYGDEYVYYYKGHPGWPTAGCEVRQAAMQRLADEGFELFELDNAIAAEVILFYNPDVYLSGWQSTTFESVASQEMACLIFGSAVADVNATYRDKVDMAARRLDAGMAAYEGIELNNTHQYFVVEYNNTVDYQNQVENYEKHEIALYDATTDTIAYYKMTTGVYAAVNADGTPIA